MKLVVGLGNSQKEYEHTRHNVGYKVAELFASEAWCAMLSLDKSSMGNVMCHLSAANVDGIMVPTIKPIAGGMNGSGKPTKFVSDLFEPDEIIVVYDDMDLEVGEINIRKKASKARHNGIKSVISNIGKNFIRVRIGIGRPKNGEAIDHVLGEFKKSEQKIMSDVYVKACNAIDCIVMNGVDKAMLEFN